MLNLKKESGDARWDKGYRYKAESNGRWSPQATKEGNGCAAESTDAENRVMSGQH